MAKQDQKCTESIFNFKCFSLKRYAVFKSLQALETLSAVMEREMLWMSFQFS